MKFFRKMTTFFSMTKNIIFSAKMSFFQYFILTKLTSFTLQ